MSDSVVLVPREFKANLKTKTEQNKIDKLQGVITLLQETYWLAKNAHGDCIEVLTSVIDDLQSSCKHEPDYLAEDLVLQPSKKENIYLAQTPNSLMKTFAASCKHCNKIVRYFVSEICPSCFKGMKKSIGDGQGGAYNSCEYLPWCQDVGYADPSYIVLMSTCPECKLTVVWNMYCDLADWRAAEMATSSR